MRYQRVSLERVGYELAPEVVTSAELEERLAPLYEELRIQPGQLAQLTGIAERRYWEPGFPIAKGAALAAQKALEGSTVTSSEIEVLIYGGVCRAAFEPATASDVAAELIGMGLAISEKAAVYDISNACLGVVNGMVEIANRIELGQIRAGMVVSCEAARSIVDATIERMLRAPDMETFKMSVATMTGGSAAAAVILTDGSFGVERRPRLLGGVTMAAPEHHMLCRWGLEQVPGPHAADEAAPSYKHFMHTDSVGVLDHGVELGSRTWRAFLEELGWVATGVDRTVCHQVGSVHRDTILKMIDLPPEHDFIAYEFLGNTGTVALPLALGLAEEREFIRPGHRVGLLGIASGLNCLMLGAEW